MTHRKQQKYKNVLKNGDKTFAAVDVQAICKSQCSMKPVLTFRCVHVYRLMLLHCINVGIGTGSSGAWQDCQTVSIVQGRKSSRWDTYRMSH